MSGIRLRHLAFTGPNVPDAELKFGDGLNILYGASNTGKSFTAQTILFMIGAVKNLPVTEEVAKYDGVWLGLTLPDGNEITLYRAARGGPFKKYDGLVKAAGTLTGTTLLGQHDHRRNDTVSQLLLEAIGLAGRKLVTNANGAKDNLSIRLLSPYAVVSEEAIIAQQSPVLYSGAPTERTLEQNLFKLLLTGIDDSATVEVQKPGDKKVAKAAKIELLDEWIGKLDEQLGEDVADEDEINDQLDRLDNTSEGLWDRLRLAQSSLDELIRKRRALLDRRQEHELRLDELDITLQRFASLNAVYSSDLERLRSIEEGGYVLVALTDRECPVCGAPPEAQVHDHAGEEIALAYAAAAAETRKIEVEQRELIQTVSALRGEAASLRRVVKELTDQIEEIDSQIENDRPLEAMARSNYETYASARAELQKIADLYTRRAELVAGREEIDGQSTKRDGDALAVGPDSTVAFAFGEAVKAVLKEWKFPDADKAQFDLSTNDITIGGKPRSSNGKGVRAILHAAFNVALFVYCIGKKLPHPGFLVLDTPLLTYREPMRSEKHGALTEDEIALKATTLAENFYKHLASLKDQVQFIIIENIDPPATIDGLANITTFTGLDGNDRYGLLARR
jgi:predicted nuclease with TOPRIM domain